MLIQGAETRIARVKFAPVSSILVAAPDCLSAETKLAARSGGQTARLPWRELTKNADVRW
jgi:hypothetical protein